MKKKKMLQQLSPYMNLWVIDDCINRHFLGNQRLSSTPSLKTLQLNQSVCEYNVVGWYKNSLYKGCANQGSSRID